LPAGLTLAILKSHSKMAFPKNAATVQVTECSDHKQSLWP
jgi:hypothetical protein